MAPKMTSRFQLSRQARQRYVPALGIHKARQLPLVCHLHLKLPSLRKILSSLPLLSRSHRPTHPHYLTHTPIPMFLLPSVLAGIAVIFSCLTLTCTDRNVSEWWFCGHDGSSTGTRSLRSYPLVSMHAMIKSVRS